MTPQQIFATALRLFALWLVISSFKYLVSLPKALEQYWNGDHMDLTMGTGVVMLVMAVIIWFFPLWISHKLIPRTQFENHVRLQPLEAARVGSALIGLWFFAEAALNLTWYFISFIINDSTGYNFQKMAVDDRVTFIYTIFELVLSLALMLRAGDFARLVVREKQGA